MKQLYTCVTVAHTDTLQGKISGMDISSGNKRERDSWPYRARGEAVTTYKSQAALLRDVLFGFELC